MNEQTVTIGRLKKKILKLQKQRDHFKEQNELMYNMIQMYPHIKRTYADYERIRQKEMEFKVLKSRVAEQELLIRLLTNAQDVWPSDIRKAYDEIIKREYSELNKDKT